VRWAEALDTPVPQTEPPPRVLLVEPNFILRRTLAEAARLRGLATVDEAATLEQAQALAVAQRYALVVLAQEAADAAPDAALAQLVALARAPRGVLLADADADGVNEVATGTARVLHRPVRLADLLAAPA
jgi:AmiR/NasT family two-component response regulator